VKVRALNVLFYPLFSSSYFDQILTICHIYVMANVESGLELRANVESSEKLIIRVEFLLVS
jgi:hypothetical protein